MRSRINLACCLAALLVAGSAAATETEVLYLSGTGYGDTVDWEFLCTEGRGCGTWTTIPVPSQWELEGFGSYNYGHDRKKSDEEGRYRHRFRVPAAWRDRTVDLVFEGVMTDAEVRLNGEPTGPRHQGAFYRFRYDVTSLVDFDGDNVLEVTVSKQSADESVNRAERDADYWVFGGIFRPVYLEAAPRESIAHVAVDARHDGAFRLRARRRGSSRSRARRWASRSPSRSRPIRRRLSSGLRSKARFPGVPRAPISTSYALKRNAAAKSSIAAASVSASGRSS